ncbi:MAG: [protein-PII] uridylyltransferase [Actinomycetia bacterium]|nr:[protein-PII] uridylyltransferase [Actinomycetes bacterium]
MTEGPISVRRDALIADLSLRGREFGFAYSDLVDEWLAELIGDERDLALVAGGSYGRRELAPGSDLDLVLIHGGRKDIRAVADRIWYPIWDSKIALDHSVRTPKEAVAMAEADLKVVSSLLDGRVVAGDLALGDDALSRVREAWTRHGARRLPQMRELATARHHKDGDVAYLLEPELKLAKGGHRDLRAMAALEAATPITFRHSPDLDQAAATLFEVRVALHRVEGRAVDRLLLDRQDDVAEQLGYADADELMRAVATSGRTVARAYDDEWRRSDAWARGPARRGAGGGDRPLGDGIVLRDGELDLVSTTEPADLTLLLRAAEQAAVLGVDFRTAALERLAAEAPPALQVWPAEARDALVGLLGAGPNLVSVFETLDEYGLLTKILPEWEQVRSKPQRNAFHRFTVDRHLAETAANAAEYTRLVERPDLLLVGCWLHDLGKGWPGDHTRAGIELMRTVATRMGFADDDVEILVDLVRHHLLLPSVATSGDLSDPAVAEMVAMAVGSVEELHLLAALTQADSLATGPSAWSAWKQELMETLVRKVELVLRDEVPPAETDTLAPEDAALIARAHGDLLVERVADGIAVVGPNRPGLLCCVVGLLSVHGWAVQAAFVNSYDGVAANHFLIERSYARRDDNWEQFVDELRAALIDRRTLDERVEQRARTYPRRRNAARPAKPRVIRHEGASATATVLEVRTADRLGLLYRLTRALTEVPLDIVHAKVSTLGQEVIDTFYLHTTDGAIPDDDTIERASAMLLEAASAGPVDASSMTVPSPGE